MEIRVYTLFVIFGVDVHVMNVLAVSGKSKISSAAGDVQRAKSADIVSTPTGVADDQPIALYNMATIGSLPVTGEWQSVMALFMTYEGPSNAANATELLPESVCSDCSRFRTYYQYGEH